MSQFGIFGISFKKKDILIFFGRERGQSGRLNIVYITMTTMSDKQHKKREFILRELVDTEAKFVRHMKEVKCRRRYFLTSSTLNIF
jgi:hypothetical protein